MSSIYQSTSLEQAYSLYLAQNIFGIVPGNSIQISGRHAVPFLTQSNVDRGILRSLWSVADPNNIGTLFEMSQFQLLLRLVAMAQASMLNPQLTSDQMKQLVIQSAGQQLPLPVFSSVIIPAQEQMLYMYANFIKYNNANPVPSTPVNQGGFWSLSQTSTPLSSGYTPQELQKKENNFGSSESLQTSSTLSVSDAFGGIVEVEDAPLPSLQKQHDPVEEPQQAEENFQGFEDAPQPYSNVQPEQDEDNFGVLETITPAIDGTPATSISDAFGAFENVQDAPLPSLEPPTLMDEPQQEDDNDNDDDDFGGFTDAAPAEAIVPPEQAENAFGGFESMTPPTDSVPVTSISDAFGAFGDVQDAPLPSLTTPTLMDEPKQEEKDDDDDFGGFEDAAPTETIVPPEQAENAFGGFESMTPPTDSVPVTSISDAFGDVQDAPLPSLTAPTLMDEPKQEDDNDNEDFGGFEDAAPTETIVPPDQAEDVFGGFESMAPTTDSAPIASISDAFGAFGDVQDAPLPSLTTPTLMDEPQQQDDDDDFGGFEGAAQPESNSQLQKEEDVFGGFESMAPAPDTVPVTSISDAFGDVQDAPLPSLTAPTLMDEPKQEDDNDNEDFGGFEDAAPTETIVPPEQAENVFGGFESMAPTTDSAPIASISDAFGGFENVEDAPLPTLQPTSLMDEPHPQPDDDDDGFGGFADAAPTESIVPPTQAEDAFGGFESTTPATDSVPVTSISEDAFGGFGDVQDAPLPSLQAPTLMDEPRQEEDDDDFGGFQDSPAVDEPQTDETFGGFEGSSELIDSAPLASISDPFGVLDDVPDVPSPSLNPMDAKQQPEVDEGEDDFGGFESVATNDNLAPVASLIDTFGVVGESYDAPLPALQSTDMMKQPQHKEDDFGGFEDAFASNSSEKPQEDADFGGFENVTPDNNDAPADSMTDAFGNFNDAQDIPPPSLPQTDLIEQTEEPQDDFGVFETAEPASNIPDSAISDDFGAFEESQDAPLPSLPESVFMKENEQDQDFGAFTEAGTITSPVPSNSLLDAASDDEFGADFGEFEKVEAVSSSQSDDFGDFGGFEEADTTNVPEAATATQTVVVSEDEFGAEFGDFDVAPARPDPTIESTEDDDFGDFEGDFGNFENAESISTPQPDLKIDVNSNDGFGDFAEDFGGFEEATPVKDKSSMETSTVEKLGALSLQLPESLLRKSGLSGEHVDLGECFEVNVGDESSLDGERKIRVDRCIQVLELLSTSNSKLASIYWAQIFDVVQDEMTLCKGLLADARKLSANGLNQVKKSLQIMISGLVEYLRVTRSIVATIGDILMLESSALLTIDTWASTWCSLLILEKPLEIERLWKETEKEIDGLALSFTTDNVTVSLENIRRRASNLPNSKKLCQLTLVPLSVNDNGTTSAEVLWQGKDFMACSANFLAHRCPFYVVAE